MTSSTGTLVNSLSTSQDTRYCPKTLTFSRMSIRWSVSRIEKFVSCSLIGFISSASHLDILCFGELAIVKVGRKGVILLVKSRESVHAKYPGTFCSQRSLRYWGDFAWDTLVHRMQCITTSIDWIEIVSGSDEQGFQIVVARSTSIQSSYILNAYANAATNILPSMHADQRTSSFHHCRYLQ